MVIFMPVGGLIMIKEKVYNDPAVMAMYWKKQGYIFFKQWMAISKTINFSMQ